MPKVSLSFHCNTIHFSDGILQAFVFVAAEILDEIAKAKFTDPTPIQVRNVFPSYESLVWVSSSQALMPLTRQY